MVFQDLARSFELSAALQQQIDATFERLGEVRRRQNQYDNPSFQEEQLAADEARRIRLQKAHVDEVIAVGGRILETRVQQLHHYALRRCATYKRHLLRRHPDGAAIIPLLDSAEFGLPSWLQDPAM